MSLSVVLFAVRASVEVVTDANLKSTTHARVYSTACAVGVYTHTCIYGCCVLYNGVRMCLSLDPFSRFCNYNERPAQMAVCRVCSVMLQIEWFALEGKSH
jgi:hypothetical protein